MDPRQLFFDERYAGACVYCGSIPETRDHVPSKVLLDNPYPSDLPVVGCCSACNSSFSLDEQYVACFIECVICGSAEDCDLRRTKIQRILNHNESLRSRIINSRKDGLGVIYWEPELDRFQNVILKLARGHAAYELYPLIGDPLSINLMPLQLLNEEQRYNFECLSYNDFGIWPEIGTRLFMRAWGKPPDKFDRVGDWIIVQPERYRYAVSESEGVLIRMVLSEYLACEVLWDY